MKRTLKNIASLSLAFLVLFSSTSFAVNQHFCGSKLIDVSVFGNSSNCSSSTFNPQQNQCLAAASCCSDSIITVDRSDLLSFSFDIEFDKIVALSNDLSQTFLSILEDSKTFSFKEYSPPKLTKDILVVFEVFLI